LNGWHTATGEYDDSTKGTITWDALTKLGLSGSSICNIASQLYSRFDEYQDWVLQYHVFAGPNSNSFTHWLIDGVPDLSGIQPPLGAVAWNKDGLIPFGGP
jgi:hypothetical protein